MKFRLFCLSWSCSYEAACVLFCTKHFFLPFFSCFQKDLFLRTDEPHTEKTNRPDCLVLSTHHWRQIFRRAQFPRRHLHKWQILKSGKVLTSFGAQLVLELLWKACSATAVLLHYAIRHTNPPLLYSIYVPLPCLPSCHAPPHRSWLASSCFLPCPPAVIKRPASTHSHFLQGAHQA